MAHDYMPNSSQWNNEPEYQLNDEAKEFGAYKRMAEQTKQNVLPAENDARDVFISYSSSEYGVAQRMRGVLQNNGISCWMAPEDIPSGSNYTKEIPTAIRSCKVFVLMLSECAQQSHWVLKELNAAVNEGKLILPFMLENCGLIDEFNFLLSGAQWFPAFQHPEDAMEKLTQRVNEVLGDDGAPDLPAPTHATVKLPPIPPVETVSIPPQKESDVPISEKNKKQTGKGKKSGRRKKRCEGELICPACGSSDLSPIKKKGYTKTERLRRSLHLVGCILLPLLVLILTWYILVALWMDGDLAGVIAAILGIVILILMLTIGRKRVQEKIRRHRVRKHIRVSGVRCNVCDKVFVQVIDEGQTFPWEGPRY